ncbi:fibronectin type III domain-containing protein [Desulfosporosinus fructosivorans]|uniref:fibronectin type III domain-containing protein n=1 Tax=Desulfosporosinus fructosivorans TaxID=2018669 RepID=UPI0018EE58A4|nr:fibronectin type III domain-containing protein [Desulfosporosinus fructosivorans]
MPTPPQDFSFYKLTQTSVYLQWYSTGTDTNYTDIVCYPLSGTNTMSYFDPNTVVFRRLNIHTPNSQYYSDMIDGLTPGTKYVCALHSKYDTSGTGESALVRSPEFTTLSDSSGDPSGSALAQQLVYVKTNIAGYFFDAILQTNYTRSLTITQHPVETGAAISDHAYVNPVELTMLIGMTDCATSIIPGQFAQGSSRSQTAFQVLTQLQSLRIPMDVMSTKFGLFKNMLIETIAVPDDYTTGNALKATVSLKEVFVASVKTVKTSARPHVTDTTNRGEVVPQEPNASALYQIEQNLKGYVDKMLGSFNA